VANTNIKSGDVPVGRFEFVLQLALIVGLCLGAASLWPYDLLNSPVAAITFPEVLRAASAPGLVLAAAAWLYLLVKARPTSKEYERAAIDERSGVAPLDKTPSHLRTPGYRSQ
jgi:hypothetical protein